MVGGGVQKIESLLKMQILWILFWGSPQNWTIFGVHFYAFTGLFLSSRCRTGIIFVCCLFFLFIIGNPQINNNDHPKRNIQKILDLNCSKKMHGLT